MSVRLNLEAINKSLNETGIKFFVVVYNCGTARVFCAGSKEGAIEGINPAIIHCVLEIPPMKVVAM
jgi:hypothetical protein